MITIKKYPNRRLYDTSQSRYINMDAVKTLIRRDQAFVVQDSKSSEDITRQILMQIICEHESQAHHSIMPRALLKQLIRQYGTEHQALLRKHLDGALELFLAEVAGDDEPREPSDQAAAGDWPMTAVEPLPRDERLNYLAASGSMDISS